MGRCSSDLNISNICPRELSFGVDELFPTSISLITKTQKMYANFNKDSTNFSIDSQSNWVPARVSKFTLQNK